MIGVRSFRPLRNRNRNAYASFRARSTMKTHSSWAVSLATPDASPRPSTCRFLHNVCCRAQRAHCFFVLRPWKFLLAVKIFHREHPAPWVGTHHPNRLNQENIFPRGPMATWAIPVLHYGLTLSAGFQLLC